MHLQSLYQDYSVHAKGCYCTNTVVESFISALKLERDVNDNAKEPISLQHWPRNLALWNEG